MNGPGRNEKSQVTRCIPHVRHTILIFSITIPVVGTLKNYRYVEPVLLFGRGHAVIVPTL